MCMHMYIFIFIRIILNIFLLNNQAGSNERLEAWTLASDLDVHIHDMPMLLAIARSSLSLRIPHNFVSF